HKSATMSLMVIYTIIKQAKIVIVILFKELI
ncbi:hypothetical protein SA3733_03640, partial [Aggregatibacter actinomycetemcomitans serotype d str. SA3733]